MIVITTILVIASLLAVFVFIVLGIVQGIRGRNFKKPLLFAGTSFVSLILFTGISMYLASNTNNISEIAQDSSNNEVVEETSLEEESSSLETKEQEEEPDNDFYIVGETVTLNDIEVTVKDAGFTDFRREYASENWENLIWVDVDIKNNSDKDIVLQSLFEAYVDNKEVELYRTDDDSIFKGGPLRAGREFDGNLGIAFNGDYEGKDIELVFSPFLSDVYAIYKLQSEE